MNASELATKSAWEHCLEARRGSPQSIRALEILACLLNYPQRLRNLVSDTLASLDAEAGRTARCGTVVHLPACVRSPLSPALSYALSRVSAMSNDDGPEAA